MTMKDNIDVTFTCGGSGCSARVTLVDIIRASWNCPIVICPGCNRLLEFKIGYDGGGDDTFSRRSWTLDIQTLSDEALGKIPERILQTIREAVRSFGAGSHYACVAMCRRIVEGIVVTEGAQGRTLKDKIANLGNRRLISEDVEDADGYLRSLGNIACHFDSIPAHEIHPIEARNCLLTAYEVTKDVFLGINMPLGSSKCVRMSGAA